MSGTEGSAWEKVAFTRKQKKAFKAQRQALAHGVKMLEHNQPTPVSGGINSYAVAGAAAGGDPSNPNSYIPAPTQMSASMPDWYSAPQALSPDAAKPLPTGKSMDRLDPGSPELLSRQKVVKDFKSSPAEFVDKNAMELNQDETLLDKGMGFLGGLFNYEDEADLSILGVPLAPVEGAWDMFNRYYTGVQNVKDVGIGGLLSWMPGGIDTLSAEELSGGLSFGEVLHGDMGLLDNAAPSPMQIAIASVAVESKRIREGGARLSDVLLLNPATAPFILAGIAAESSPLQKDDFNLMDPEQRKAAFASGGWEQFFSGFGDFGVQMADPTIAVGVGYKIITNGLLGVAKGAKFAGAVKAASTVGLDEVLAKNAADQGVTALTMAERALIDSEAGFARSSRGAALREGVDPQFNYGIPTRADAAPEFWDNMDEAGILSKRTKEEAQQAYADGRRLRDMNDDAALAKLPDGDIEKIKFAKRMEDQFTKWHNKRVEKAAKEAGDPVPDYVTKDEYANRVRKNSDELGIKAPMARIINDVVQVDEFDNKVMSVDEIAKRVEFRRNAEGRRFATVLHQLKDPYHATLAIQAAAHVPGARKLLYDTLPALYDQIYRIHADTVMSQMQHDPTRWSIGRQSLVESRRSMMVQRANLDSEVRKPRVIGQNPDGTDILSHNVTADSRALEQRQRIDQSIEELDALIGFMDGRQIDLMAPGPFHVPEYVENVISDMYKQGDAIEAALQRDLKDAMIAGDRDALFITKDNWYARQIGKHRERSANAAYTYSLEGTGLIPQRNLVGITAADEAGNLLEKAKARYEWEWGWVSGSEYGTSRVRRAARVWRWMGTETPAGYVGLKGTALVGSEREIDAVLNLDAYRGKPVEVTWWENGEMKTDFFGGEEKRRYLMGLWDEALRNPMIDKKSVLTKIEDEITRDFARMYGVPLATMEDAIKRASGYRAQTLDLVRKHGFTVDPETGKQHHTPWLKGQLANGTYMHNWEHIERTLQRRALDTYGPKAGTLNRKFAKGGDTAMDYTRNADQLFQSFWRPLVLLRLSYTQRNVFEGMVRSAAYFASLAPVLWPAQATYFGISNKARRALVKRATQKIEKDPLTRELYRERMNLLPVFDRHHTLNTATAPWQPDHTMLDSMFSSGELSPDYWDEFIKQNPQGPYRFIWGRNMDPEIQTGTVVKKIMTEDEYQIALADSYDAVIKARVTLEPLEDQFDALVGNGRFKKWRDAAIRDMDSQACEMRSVFSGLQTSTAAGVGGVTVLDNIMAMSDTGRSLQVVERNLDTLRYDPIGAIQMYRAQAARNKSIGSGQSRGPDGNYASDAWDDEMEMMNKGVASSETARRTTLSSASNANENMFRASTIRENVPVPYDPLEPEKWYQAMAENIERNSFNPIVGILMDNEMNTDAVLEWMLRTPKGREFMVTQRWLEGTDFDKGALTKYLPADRGDGITTYQATAFDKIIKVLLDGEDGVKYQTVDTRLKKMSEAMRDPVTGRMELIDNIDSAMKYVSTTAFELRKMLQEAPQLMAMQGARARSVAAGSPIPVTAHDVQNLVMTTMTPEQIQRLGPILGSDLIEQGTKGFLDTWRAMVNKVFHVIGTIPEDSAVRFPFYNKRFKQVRNELIELWWEENNGGLPASAKRGLFSKAGKYDPEGFTSPEIRIPKQDLEDILYASHKKALFDMREYLYTIERRTNLGKYGEYIWPFISATQNTLQAGGRILHRNPFVAPLIVSLWRAPEKLGWRDDEGNLRMPMPFEAVNEWLKDREDIPVLGGILSGGDFITIPQNGLNVFAPDTGFFGIVPRPGANIQWVSSQAMQLGMVPVEPPAAFTAVMGDEKATETWSLVKDYMFGDTGSMSTRIASYDVLLPPAMRRFLDSRDEMSEQYSRLYALEEATQKIRIAAGERSKPEDLNSEIHKRVTNMFWFNILGAIGVPTPMTPYPILTRPDVQKDTVQILQQTLKSYMAAQGQLDADGNPVIEPGMATMMFSRDFGDDLLPLAMSGTRTNTSGADPTEATVADAKAFEHIIRDVAPKLGTDMELLDIIVNNSNGPAEDFSDEAFRYQKITRVPGTGEFWADQLSPEEAENKRNRDSGWVKYQQFVDGLEAKMYSAGVKSTQHAGGKPYALAKEAFIIEAQKSNPDWYLDFTDTGGNRTNKTIMVLETVANDEKFNQRMFDNGQEGLLGAMKEYVFYRKHMVSALEASGESINDPSNAALKESWDVIRQRLKESDVRWGEIANRWLSSDDNPQYPGDWAPSVMVGELEGAR